MSNTLCLAGMHRSGTSLTASWLQECGMVLDAGSVIEQSEWNVKGHFEDKDFVRFHEDIILSYQKNSWGWKIYPQTSLFFPNSQLERAKNIIEIRNSHYPLWGWKDPRTTLFLEQWKQIIPNLKMLSVWRPATEVISSLLYRARKTDKKLLKINLLEATKLWLCYNKRIYEYKQTYPQETLLLPLSYIVKNDRHTFDLIGDRLKISLKYTPLNTLYEHKLINQRKGLNSLYSLIVSLNSEIPIIEKKLKVLSDI